MYICPPLSLRGAKRRGNLDFCVLFCYSLLKTKILISSQRMEILCGYLLITIVSRFICGELL